MRASTTNELDKKGAETMMKLLDALEDLDDVQKVYSNAEIPDNILAELKDGILKLSIEKPSKTDNDDEIISVV